MCAFFFLPLVLVQDTSVEKVVDGEGLSNQLKQRSFFSFSSVVRLPMGLKGMVLVAKQFPANEISAAFLELSVRLTVAGPSALEVLCARLLSVVAKARWSSPQLSQGKLCLQAHTVAALFPVSLASGRELPFLAA